MGELRLSVAGTNSNGYGRILGIGAATCSHLAPTESRPQHHHRGESNKEHQKVRGAQKAQPQGHLANPVGPVATNSSVPVAGDLHKPPLLVAAGLPLGAV